MLSHRRSVDVRVITVTNQHGQSNFDPCYNLNATYNQSNLSPGYKDQAVQDGLHHRNPISIMSSLPVSLPLNRSLLFHEQVNFHMENNPTLPMFVYADDQASDHHTTEISFLEFGRAAHRIAHALRPKRAGNEGQVVMLIANCDTILFHTVVAGMFMSGLVVSVPA